MVSAAFLMERLITSIADLGLNEFDSLALANELQKGWNINKATEAARERAAAQEAEKQRLFHRGSKLLKPVLTLDQQQYEELCSKYGYEAFGDRGFIKDMQRLCPETKICSA